MKAIFRRAAAAAGGTLAVLVCALAAHAAAYRSFWPEDGVHGYFIWYALVVVLSGASSRLSLSRWRLAWATTSRSVTGRAAVLAWLRPWRPFAARGREACCRPWRAAGAGVGRADQSASTTSRLGFPASTWLVIPVRSRSAASITFSPAGASSRRSSLQREVAGAGRRVKSATASRLAVDRSAGHPLGMRAPPSSAPT